MTLLKCSVPFDGACHVFEESVLRLGGYVPAARRGRPERNGILAQGGGGMDAGVGYSSRESRYVLLANRDRQLRALRFRVTRQAAGTEMK